MTLQVLCKVSESGARKLALPLNPRAKIQPNEPEKELFFQLDNKFHRYYLHAKTKPGYETMPLINILEEWVLNKEFEKSTIGVGYRGEYNCYKDTATGDYLMINKDGKIVSLKAQGFTFFFEDGLITLNQKIRDHQI